MSDRFTLKHRFYAPSDAFTATHVVLPEDEARHAVKVLRLSEGDDVTVVDGVGRTVRATLETVSKKSVIARIQESEDGVGESGQEIHVGMALLHQASRFETFLEKAVELGVTRITPLVTTRVQQRKFNRRRADLILVGALKQSGRSVLPVLDEPMDWPSFLSAAGGHRVVCHESADPSNRLASMVGSVEGEGHSVWSVAIGPEGGFTDDEINGATDAGWDVCWLGSRRLRAETAAIVAMTLISQAGDAD